ncbi:MAG: ACT domain-containing protein [Melioribacteraceae bacterium]
MKITEEKIRELTLKAIEELGQNSSAEAIKLAVEKAIGSENVTLDLVNEKTKSTGKVILTSFGLDHPGIVAGVTTALGKANCDITDLSQKLMGDFYTMIVILDISNSSKSLTELQTELNQVAEELKIKVYLQHEDLFRQMHRV